MFRILAFAAVRLQQNTKALLCKKNTSYCLAPYLISTLRCFSMSSVAVDLEAGAGEQTPLLSRGEPPPLQDMKAESLKEKTVAGFAAAGCT